MTPTPPAGPHTRRPVCRRRRQCLLGALAGCVPGAWAVDGTRPADESNAPPAVLLARDAPPGLDPAGWLVSEKFDGVRAVWDGRVLRFRGGAVVEAPGDFLRGLPAGQPLDGELWLARGRFDELSGIVRAGASAGDRWAAVRYLVFELPGAPGTFQERTRRLHALAAAAPAGRRWEPVVQQEVSDAAALRRLLAQVVAAGGEGLMLHRADAPYVTGRSPGLLKLKTVQDADGVVVGHTAGRGRHAGAVGALRVRGEDGREFLIGSGLTDAQRRSPPPVGSVVTYTWRGRTAQGLPRFATLWRVREAGW